MIAFRILAFSDIQDNIYSNLRNRVDKFTYKVPMIPTIIEKPKITCVTTSLDSIGRKALKPLPINNSARIKNPDAKNVMRDSSSTVNFRFRNIF